MSKKANFLPTMPSWVWIGLAVITGAIARFAFITKSSIWHDEGFSILLAKRSSVEIWIGSARDVHPPLYYLLLHWWMKLFGDSVVAIRSLSAVASLGVIIVGFLIIKRMAGQRAAILAAFILALAPFLVRYSQEARMYGLLGLFMLLALYAVMRIVEQPKIVWPYVLYAIMIGFGMYTHYFTGLAVIAFWVYLIFLQSPKQWRIGKTIFLSLKWWLANVAALLLFLPWLPSAFAQLTRGQGLGWLPKATLTTFHDTIWQFLTFTDAHNLGQLVFWLVPIVVVCAALYVLITNSTKEKYACLLVSYSFVPIFLTLLISTQKPLFHERYFAFAAIGIYLIIAMAIDRLAGKHIWVFGLLSAVVIGTEIIGVRNVYAQANHQMAVAMQAVNQQYISGDTIIAGEMYVYFDGSYYNQTNQKILLYTGISQPNGYGESGLLYNQNVYIDSFAQIPQGSRVWLVGKTGEHQYYNNIPASWQLIKQSEAGYSEMRLYAVK